MQVDSGEAIKLTGKQEKSHKGEHRASFIGLSGRVSLLNNHGCPGTRSVDQAGLKVTEIQLPLPPDCRD